MTTVTSPAGSGPVPPTVMSSMTAEVPGNTATGHHACDPSHHYQAYQGYQLEYAPPGRFTAFMMRLWARSPRWLAPMSILVCFAGAAGYVLVSNPTDDAAGATSSCLVKLTTGYDCPGCGGTRAFFYLLHGNLPAAARHHLLFVFAVPFLVYMYVAWTSERVFQRKLPELRLSPLALGLFLTAWAVFSVLRNVPLAPFTWLYV